MALPQLELTTHSAEIGPDEFVLTVDGELDLYSTPRFEDALGVLFDLGAATIVLDLRPLLFLDSTGIGAITAGVKRSREQGGAVVIACDGPEVLRTLSRVGLDRFVPVRSSLTAAIDELRGRSA